MKTFTGTQLQLNKIDKNTLLQFKATTDLHNSLVKDRKKTNTRTFQNTGKQLLQQARIEKMNEKINPTKELTIETEVIALSNFGNPITNERTCRLIEKQREQRREKHLKTLNDFQKWVDSLCKDVVQGYIEIKSDIDNYFVDNDRELNLYFDNLTDDNLLKREKDLIAEINEIVKSCEIKKKDKLNNLDERLEELEKERENNLNFFCNKLQFSLIDIAFLLEFEVKKQVNEKHNEFIGIIKSHREQNALYVQRIKDQQILSLNLFIQKQQQTIYRWKQLKHNEALNEFSLEIKTLAYVNPEKRKDLYKVLKQKHIEIYNSRIQYIDKLNSTDMAIIIKSYCDKILEDIKNFNDKAQQQYDECFENIMKESEESKQFCMNRAFKLKQRLEYIEYLSQDEMERLMESDIYTQIDALYEKSRDLIGKAMRFVEDNDFKQNELTQNVCKLFQKIGEKNDENKKNLSKLNLQYELQKATAADENDEKIERLNEEFSQIKMQLKQALHHPKLNEILQVSFIKLDEIENEYRSFHEQNMQIAKQHPSQIKEQFIIYEKMIVPIFYLLEESQRQEIANRNLKLAQEKALKIIQREERIKEIEEYKATLDAQTNNKKGAPKKPQTKKQDPKKAQQEADIRLKQIMDQIGVEQIQILKSPFDNDYIVSQNDEELATKLYEFEDDEKLQKRASLHQKVEEGIQKQSQMEIPILEEELPPLKVDHKQEPPKDPEGNQILEQNIVVETSYIMNLIQNCRKKLFEFILKLLNEVQLQNKNKDKEFIEDSILNLDERLKSHYPLKGKVEVEIYQLRSAQITLHKKRYERFARQNIEKIDLQTEHFNFLMEQALEDMKEHELEQKKYKDSLLLANKLAKLQGIQNHVKENAFQFGEKIRDLQEKLQTLANDEIDFMLAKNKFFIKESKLFEDDGEYSNEEVQWYESMLNEIDVQLEMQKVKRNERILEILTHMSNKKKDLLEQFDKAYIISIEELAAKDGTGIKYGRPRRYVQERMRSEMTKCEKAQDHINEYLNNLKELYEEFIRNQNNSQTHISEHSQQNKMKLFSNRTRRVLMILRTIIRRYSIHINALKVTSQLQEMPRVTYIENKFDCVIDPSELDQDKVWFENEMEQIGPLFYQKEGLKFSEWVSEIERNTVLEAQKIYVGDKAKFLTGSDKCPDYLRIYIQNNAKNAEEFRIQCCRNLRNSCQSISNFAPCISEMNILSIKYRYEQYLIMQNNQLQEKFKELERINSQKKEENIVKLRPNLSNPQCKEELKQLVKDEEKRLREFLDQIELYKKSIFDLMFNTGSEFFKALLSNFEFLIIYFDCMLLFEDFNKLPGDDDIQKKHENIKVLYRIKQKGTNIDTGSERSISKTWPGLLIDSFNIEERKLEYKLSQPVEDNSNNKGKKEAKKGKQPTKKTTIVIEEGNSGTNTKDIKSFKTHIQKSANGFKNRMFEEFKKRYDLMKQEIEQYFENSKNMEYKFEFKWQNNVYSLNNT